MSGVVDGPLAQLQGVADLQFVRIARVQDAVRVRGAGPNRKHVPGQPLTLAVDVVQARATLVPTADHGPLV